MLNSEYDTLAKYLKYCIDNYYLPDVNSIAMVPIMTSNTAPYGTAFTTETPYSGQAYMAFDGVESTHVDGRTNATYIRIGYTNGEPFICSKVKVFGSLKDFVIQGSNDGTNWTSVSPELQYAKQKSVQFFTFKNTTAYKYWALYAYNGTWNGVSYTPTVSVLQFYNK